MFPVPKYILKFEIKKFPFIGLRSHRTTSITELTRSACRKVTHFSLRNIIEIIINCWNENQIYIEFTVICLLLLLSLCCCLNTKLLTKNKWVKKQGREEKSLYVSTSRLDTYISYDKSKRWRRRRPIHVYLYMNILYCCFVVKYAGYINWYVIHEKWNETSYIDC